MCKKTNNYFWILIALCICSLVIFLGNTLFNTKGEPREAVVAMSMLNNGNWILPINNGTDFAYKPPMFHWCIAVFSLFAGHVTEFTSRLPSAISLIAMVLVGFKFYEKRCSAQTAFLMSLITITNFEVHRAGTNCRVDMLLCAFIVIALYQLYKWGEKGLRGMPVAAILCMSGAFLTKGPVGIILPCLVTAVFLLIRGYKFGTLILRFMGVALAACVLPAVWYFLAYQQGGEQFLQLVYEENVLRFLGKMTYSSHEEPFYYNFITVIAGYLPYTIFVLISLFVLKYKRPSGRLKDLAYRLWTRIKGMGDARLFSLLSIAIIFVFYCIPKSKRSVYLLPIYPFMAFFLAEYMVYIVRRHYRALRMFGHVLASIVILVVVSFLTVRMGLVPDDIFTGKHAMTNVKMLHSLETSPLDFWQYLVILVPLVAAGMFWFKIKAKGVAAIYSVISIAFSIFLTLDGVFLPMLLNAKSDKGMAMQIAKIVPTGRVYSFRTDITVGNMMHPYTTNFYLGDRIVPFNSVHPREGYLLTGNSDIDSFKVKNPDYKVVEVVNFNHKSCDDKKMQHLYKFKRMAEAKVSEFGEEGKTLP